MKTTFQWMMLAAVLMPLAPAAQAGTGSMAATRPHYQATAEAKRLALLQQQAGDTAQRPDLSTPQSAPRAPADSAGSGTTVPAGAPGR